MASSTSLTGEPVAEIEVPLEPSLSPASLFVDQGYRRQPATGPSSAGAQQTIDNPLLVFDDTIAKPNTGRTELEDYVLEFLDRSNLADRSKLLMFGARLARDKHEAMTKYAEKLTEREKKVLNDEKEEGSGFWKQSKFFRATIITASLGGMIQGWTQSANNSTIYGMPEEFGLCVTTNKSCVENTSDLWTFGMLNAIPLLSAGLFGTTLADPLQENFLGRRGSVMLSSAITIAATIGASATHSVAQLAICRAINGMALGAKASIIPIYSAEISPEHIRGAILANWQLADAAGIFLGFLANLIIINYVHDSYRSWRIITNTVLIPTVPLLVIIYLMPESPRYLMKHGRYRKAFEAFTAIQTTHLLASRDFMYAHAQLDFESRLLRRDANEYGNLNDRIAGCNNNLDGRRAQKSISRDNSPMSISTEQPTAQAKRVGNISPVDGTGQRNSHPQSSPHEFHSRQNNMDLSSINRHENDMSSLSMEEGMLQGAEKNNPYCYHIGVTGYFKRLTQLWKNQRCRRALLSASIVMISQQMSGLNTIAFLGTTLWENSLGTATNPKTNAIIGLCFGLTNYLGGLPVYWLSDRYGRSILLAAGLPNMAWSMLVFALLFQMPESSAAKVPLVSIFAIIFTLFYAPTAGTSPFSISAEVFPLVSREVGMAVSVAVNLLGAGILVLVFPLVMHGIGTTGSLSIFAGLNVVAFFLVYLFVPETTRRTLEELQYTFDLPTRLHVKYRAVYIRKHFMKNFWRYLTQKKVRAPIPFWRWARVEYAEKPKDLS